MATIGSVWEAGTWGDGVWADGTWGDAVVPTAPSLFGDLTTLFTAYVATLHDAAVVAADSDTLIAADVPTMIAATTERDDRNSQYAEYLS